MVKTFRSKAAGRKAAKKKTAVIGCGSILRSDDGAGVRVLEHLKKLELGNVDLIDAGLAGLELLDMIEGYSKVIIVDAGLLNKPAGSFAKFKPDKLKASNVITTHGFGIIEVLNFAKVSRKKLPEIFVFLIQPKSLDIGTKLSKEVERALPKLAKAIEKEVNKIS